MEVNTKEGGGERRSFNINNDGLVNMSFDRYLGSTKDSKSQVLSKVDLALFDKSGGDILSIIQQNKGKLRFRYGFDGDMSEIFELSITQLNSTYNNLGCMVAIGAVGTQVGKKFDANIFIAGTLIEDILIAMAKRNNWGIGEEYIEDNKVRYRNIDCQVKIPVELLKESDETDISFIENKLLPIANLSVSTPDASYNKELWDFRLYDMGGKAVLKFKPYADSSGFRSDTIRVWEYSYGDSISSKVIDFKNTLNYNFLINGLSIKIPALLLETIGENKITEEYLGELIYNDKWTLIEQTLESYRLPVPSKDTFALNVEIVPLEELNNPDNLKSIEDRIVDAIKNAIMSMNTINLKVIGNPKILPTDLIDLKIYNRPSGGNRTNPNILSGVWKVIKIKDEVGLNGFTTTLDLVRYIPKLIEVKPELSLNQNDTGILASTFKNSYITSATARTLRVSIPNLSDGWYTLSFNKSILDVTSGALIDDLSDPTVGAYYTNKNGTYYIPDQTETSYGIKNYNEETSTMDIYIKGGTFTIEALFKDIFDVAYLNSTHLGLTFVS
jgi:hypothetical protein